MRGNRHDTVVLHQDRARAEYDHTHTKLMPLRKVIFLRVARQGGGGGERRTEAHTFIPSLGCSLLYSSFLPERRELLHNVDLEAPDHHLVRQQQVQLVWVLGATDERHSVDGPVLRSLRSSASPGCITSYHIISYQIEQQHKDGQQHSGREYLSGEEKWSEVK